MKVFKFGGAAVATADRIRNTGRILQSYPGQPILVVISAMGKTTNALEKVVEAFYRGDKEEALSLFEEVKKHHLQVRDELLQGLEDHNKNKPGGPILSDFLLKLNGCCMTSLFGTMIITMTRWFALVNYYPLPS